MKTVVWVAVFAVVQICLSSPLSSQEQQTRTVQGVVRDSTNGETLPFASVVIPGTKISSTSNRDGFFTLLGAPADSFTIRVVFLGYRATEFPVPADAAPGLLTVEMAPVVFELTGITVVAEEARMISTVREISRVAASPEVMAVLPSVGEADVFRSLQLLPGISGTNESSSGLYVRGGTPDQNLVLLDGMTVYHVDHFFGFFSAFNAEAIKDVQVYKGGFPALYGGRVSSVVDMTGKTGDPDEPHLSIGASLLSASASAQIPLFGKGSILLSARRSYTDVMRTGLYSSIFNMFREDTTAASPPGPGGMGGMRGMGSRFGNASFSSHQPDFYFYDLNGKITYRPSTRDVLSVSLYNGQDYLDNSLLQTRTLSTQNTAFSRGISNDITDLTDWGNKGVSVKWARQWHPRLYTDALMAYSEYFSDYRRNTSIETVDAEADTLVGSRSFGSQEDNRVKDLTFRIDNEWQLSASHKIGFGGWLTRSNVDYLFTRDDSLTILDRQQEAVRAAGYLQDKWNVFPSLELTLGSRFAYYDLTGETYLEPRASAALRLPLGLTVKGAYGNYHQFVNRVVNENVTEGSRDFWLLSDGDLVDVTSARHYVLGASMELDDYLFDVEVYRKDLDGLSEFSMRYQRVGDPDPVNLFFDGTGVAEGIEFLAQKKYGTYTGWASYTLSRVEHTFPDLNNGEPFPALHDQTHEFKIVNSVNLGRLNFSGTWVAATGRPYTAPESEYSITLLDGTEQSYIHVGEKNGLRLPAYHRADVAAHYRFGIGRWTGDIGLSVFNLYDRTNVWYRQFDLSETPILVNDMNFLGITPAISVRFEF
jgi:hypothetical protein